MPASRPTSWRTRSRVLAADPAPSPVDPGGQRLAATVTAVVLAAALLSPFAALAVALVGWQLAVFTVGALLGPAATPYALLADRLLGLVDQGRSPERRDARPAQCAQTVGLALSALAFVGYAGSAPALGATAAVLGLAVSGGYAATGFCLGSGLFRMTQRPQVQRYLDYVSTSAFH